MAFVVNDILTQAQRFLIDLDDDAYRDTSTHQPMLDYYNEGQRRFACGTHCCQAVVASLSATENALSFATIKGNITNAEQILFVSKVLMRNGDNWAYLPKAPLAEMRALLNTETTIPERYTLFAESVYFDTEPGVTLTPTFDIWCSYVPTDISDSTASILIPDEWAQAVVKYIEFCCRVGDRDAGLATGAYQVFEAIKQRAAKLYLGQIERILV